jgi:hypothetical protein
MVALLQSWYLHLGCIGSCRGLRDPIRREKSRLSLVQTTTPARIGQHEYAQETAASVR